MNLRAALARVLGVTAVFAVLAFAPSAAEAHGKHGHAQGQLARSQPAHSQHAPGQHASSQHASSQHASTLRVEAPSVAVPALVAVPERSSAPSDAAPHDHDGAELRAAPDTVPANDRTVCNQSCCTGAPCHSGVAHALGSELSVMAPQDGGIGLAIGNAPGIAGHDPEGLRKPPKSFV